jgi:hypothetical protein
MSKRVQHRRGTTAQHASFTGAVGELTVDTDKKCVVVHDGATVGGIAQRSLLLGVAADAALGNVQSVYSAVSVFGSSTGDASLILQGGYLLSADGIWTSDYVRTKRMWYEPETRTYAATLIHDIRSNNYMSSVSLTGNLSLSLSNITSGFKCEVRIKSDGSIRNLTFPAGWVFIGSAAPATIAASKTGILELWCFGATDADVVARWTVQP